MPSFILLAFILSEKSLMKNLTLAYMGSERKTKFEKKNKPGKFIVSYKIQLVMVVYYAKFNASVLHSFCENFDEPLKMDKLFVYLGL